MKEIRVPGYVEALQSLYARRDLFRDKIKEEKQKLNSIKKRLEARQGISQRDLQSYQSAVLESVDKIDDFYEKVTRAEDQIIVALEMIYADVEFRRGEVINSVGDINQDQYFSAAMEKIKSETGNVDSDSLYVVDALKTLFGIDSSDIFITGRG